MLQEVNKIFIEAEGLIRSSGNTTKDGIDVLHEGDHHLITQETCDMVLGWLWEMKVKWLLKLMVVAKEFKCRARLRSIPSS
jgi:hypothetical protein